MADENWWSELRQIHDESFETDWSKHLAELNRQVVAKHPRLESDPFSTPGGTLPPVLFNGDIEALEPEKWVLVVSLNPAIDRAKEEWYRQSKFESDSYWHHWRTFNRRFYYSTFFDPLVRVASGALGEELPKDRAAFGEFATTRMCFIELCPYTLKTFGAEHAELIGDLGGDNGFRLNSRFREAIIQKGQPAAILANGNPVIEDFGKVDGRVTWGSIEYKSADDWQMTQLKWSPGVYSVPSGKDVPTVGFPFLSKSKTANSHVEYKQLGEKIRRFVQTGETE